MASVKHLVKEIDCRDASHTIFLLGMLFNTLDFKVFDIEMLYKVFDFKTYRAYLFAWLGHEFR